MLRELGENFTPWLIMISTVSSVFNIGASVFNLWHLNFTFPFNQRYSILLNLINTQMINIPPFSEESMLFY